MQLDYEHWAEVLLAGLIGLGAWLWRVGRLYQHQDDRLRRVEEWKDAHVTEHGEEESRLESKMDDLYEMQNTQNIALARIESNQDHQRAAIAELKKDLRSLGAPMPGGRRYGDPPLPPGGQS